MFTERYLRDLRTACRTPQVHRYAAASHLVTEDAPETRRGTPGSGSRTAPRRPARSPRAVRGRTAAVGRRWTARAGDPAPAVIERGGRGRRVSFGLLQRRVHELAAGLAAAGVRAGDRVALLVPPGADLAAAVYACWRAGAVIVVADPGLGPRGLARALRGAGPDHVIGVPRGLLLARTLGVPGQRIVAGPATPADPAAARRGPRAGRASPGSAAPTAPPPEPAADAECAVVFTSGATGPAKGVVYRHRQVAGPAGVLRDAFGLTGDDRLVAAFPPFALYGPALGIASAVPDIDVHRAGSYRRRAGRGGGRRRGHGGVRLPRRAAQRGGHGRRLDERHRGGAATGSGCWSPPARPSRPSCCTSCARCCPPREPHTPYGMTEALPVTDITLAEIDAAGPGNGVCVGRPLPGVDVAAEPARARRRRHRAADRGARGHRRGLRARPAPQGPLRPAVGHRARQLARPGLAPHRRRRPPRRARVGCGSRAGWGTSITHASGPVTPVGIEQRVRAAGRRSGRRRRSASGPAARSRWPWS